LSAERDARVFANTLTELAFLLFFLLLLVALANLRSLAAEKEEIARLREEAEAVTDELERRTDELEQANAELAEEVSLLREVESYVQQMGGELPVVSTDDFLHLVAAEGRALRLQQRVQSLETALVEQRTALEQARERLALLGGGDDAVVHLQAEVERLQVMQGRLEAEKLNLERRLGRGGLDLPPCWIVSEGAGRGRAEFLFNVTITDERLAVTPGWPAHREAEARQLPGTGALMAGPMTLGEFTQRAAPVFRWSAERDCRHYVRIIDRTRQKAAFKRSLLTIEGYFYKLMTKDG
jgi:hypothetical protein